MRTAKGASPLRRDGSPERLDRECTEPTERFPPPRNTGKNRGNLMCQATGSKKRNTTVKKQKQKNHRKQKAIRGRDPLGEKGLILPPRPVETREAKFGKTPQSPRGGRTRTAEARLQARRSCMTQRPSGRGQTSGGPPPAKDAACSGRRGPVTLGPRPDSARRPRQG